MTKEQGQSGPKSSRNLAKPGRNFPTGSRLFPIRSRGLASTTFPCDCVAAQYAAQGGFYLARAGRTHLHTHTPTWTFKDLGVHKRISWKDRCVRMAKHDNFNTTVGSPSLSRIIRGHGTVTGIAYCRKSLWI